MSNALTITSASVVAYINGKICGRVVSFRWSSATPRKKIIGIDSGVPQELAPTTFMCSGTLELLRTHLDGGVEALGMTAHSSQVVREKMFTLTIIDRLTDTQLFRADYCSVEDQQWSIPQKGIVMGTINWSALQWNNECHLVK